MMVHNIDSHSIAEFRQFTWEFYSRNRRDFPWRYTDDSYWVLVSEIMLQQTQTYRVEPKFLQFIKLFPTLQDLAAARWPHVLGAWQGLGYNSRAKRLHNTAQYVVKEFNGIVPEEVAILETFEGIGPATAASICAFAFNKPTIFIETNIRAVFIYHFFASGYPIHDNQIRPLVEQTLDTKDPRSWYYALMDYGVYLKQTAKNPARLSAHYAKQSKFEGSNRQIRGIILQKLLEHESLNQENLLVLVGREQERVIKIIHELVREQLIRQKNDYFSLA